jgi:3-oxoacyl-[acyl-carrier-protein] synthase I
MNRALIIHGWGAVTPVGLGASASCAAIRARVSRIGEIDVIFRPDDPLLGASVLASHGLRRTESEWLANLAARAIAECMRDEAPDPQRTVLLLAAPEPFRGHRGMLHLPGRALLDEIEARCNVRFHPKSTLLTGGPASVLEALDRVETLLADPTIDHAIVGGVDSLLNRVDLERLGLAGRLHMPDVPQGVIPGEGAAVLLVSTERRGRRHAPLAEVLGIGVARENDTVLGDRYSVGDAMCDALRKATGPTFAEPAIEFVVSTFNGERYAAWESMMCRPRFYRTRRERLPLVFPAMAVGDMGAASGAMAIIVAGMSIGRSYAPGPLAMCEAASDEGLRAACVVAGSPSGRAWATPSQRAPGP